MSEKRFEMSDGSSFCLTPVTNHDEWQVRRTSYFEFATPQDRLILRTLTKLDDKPVIYPLHKWRAMTEARREMIRAAYAQVNSPDVPFDPFSDEQRRELVDVDAPVLDDASEASQRAERREPCAE